MCDLTSVSLSFFIYKVEIRPFSLIVSSEGNEYETCSLEEILKTGQLPFLCKAAAGRSNQEVTRLGIWAWVCVLGAPHHPNILLILMGPKTSFFFL